jgi:hypothetical protein
VQAALASDATNRSFVTLCYDNVLWTLADINASDVLNNAVTGFNLGDNFTAFNITPTGTGSNSSLALSCGGSRGPTGCYTFRVDGPVIAAPVASPSPTQTSSIQVGPPSASPTRTPTPTPSRSPLPDVIVSQPAVDGIAC